MRRLAMAFQMIAIQARTYEKQKGAPPVYVELEIKEGAGQSLMVLRTVDGMSFLATVEGSLIEELKASCTN